MRDIKIGEQTVRVRATPMALLFYKQEFKSDLLGDLMKMQNVLNDPGQMDMLALLQLVYAMAKAEAYGKGPFPSFQEWLGSLESVDFGDPQFLQPVMEEAMTGFFRSGAKGIKTAIK
jgi:hypothetical protein